MELRYKRQSYTKPPPLGTQIMWPSKPDRLIRKAVVWDNHCLFSMTSSCSTAPLRYTMANHIFLPRCVTGLSQACHLNTCSCLVLSIEPCLEGSTRSLLFCHVSVLFCLGFVLLLFVCFYFMNIKPYRDNTALFTKANTQSVRFRKKKCKFDHWDEKRKKRKKRL